MSQTPYASFVLVFDVHGDVLVTSRKKSSGKYGLPGGKVDPGETSAQAAAREFLEEVGVRVRLEKKAHSGLVDGRSVVTYFGLLEPEVVVPSVGPEGQSLSWVPVTALSTPAFAYPEWGTSLLMSLAKGSQRTQNGAALSGHEWPARTSNPPPSRGVGKYWNQRLLAGRVENPKEPTCTALTYPFDCAGKYIGPPEHANRRPNPGGIPVAPSDTPWDGKAARKRILAWANGNEKKLSTAFLWHDVLAGEYKLPVVDIINGRPVLIPRAVFAAAASVEGARSGVKLSGDERNSVKWHIQELYSHICATSGEHCSVPWALIRKPNPFPLVASAQLLLASLTGVEALSELSTWVKGRP